PGRVLHARAGMLVGPHDRVYRFAYWLERLAEGGEVLAPGSPDAPLPLLDARDLAARSVGRAGRGPAGPVDRTGAARPPALDEVPRGGAEGIGARPELTWVEDAFLEAHGLAPVDSVVYWTPPALHGFFRRDIGKALAAGLAFRPLSATARDTRDALRAQPFDP